MEPDLLQIAKDAQVTSSVPDLLTLKAYAQLSKARLAYQAGNFQESVTRSKKALLIKPDFEPGYRGMGISYGRLGQWDLAVSNLEAALKIDKGNGNAESALKWAKEGLEAAKAGDSPKEQPPAWK
jgi:tetratricopeptide (TPR) repeat protein